MTDHLPECPYRVDHPRLPRNRGLICICDELRACEQRVIAEGDEQSQVAYSTGYRHALDAAEQAVATWISYTFPGFRPSWTEQITTAIRALKEKS